MIRFGPAGWEYPDWAGIVYPPGAPRAFDRLAPPRPLVLDRRGERHVLPAVRRGRGGALVRAGRGTRRTSGSARRSGAGSRTSGGRRTARRTWRPRAPRSTRSTRRGGSARRCCSSRGPSGGSPRARSGCAASSRALEGLPLVVEVRHASWDAPEVLEELARGGRRDRERGPAALPRVAPPRGARHLDRRLRARARAELPRLVPQGSRARRAVRLPVHAGRARAVGGAREGARRLARRARRVRVTNNHFRGQAVANAKMLEAMVEGRKVEAPPELVAAFPDALRPFVG